MDRLVQVDNHYSQALDFNMNVKNRRMFRPQNAGKQAAGILASSPQLMQSVQKRANGGSISASPTFFGQQTPGAKFGGSAYGGMTFGGGNPRLIPGAKFGGSTYGGMTFGGGNPRLIPSGPPQRVPGNVFANILTPKGKTALSGSGIANLLTPAAATVPDGSLYRPGTGGNGLASSPEIAATDVLRSRLFPELDIADADDAATIFTDADREDADAGTLPSEQLATSAVSGSQTKVGGAPTTGQEQEQPSKGSEKAETSGASLSAAQTRLNKFAQDQSTKGSSNVKPKVNTPEQAALPEAGAALNELLTNKPTLESATFSDVEESVKEMMGFDPDKASKDKKDAIYMNMMMAGLAMASGESPNALTNIANGLRAGLAGYAKDIKDIDERDAELQKEFRASMRDAVKNENDVRKAQATLDSTYNTSIATIKANQENTLAGITSREKIADASLAFQEQELAVNNAYRQQTFELAIINAQNTLDVNLADLALKTETLDFNKQQEISDNLFKQVELQLQYAPEEAIQAAYLGDGFATQNKDGTFSLTDKGREQYTLLLAANLSDSDDLTDLDKKANALAKVFDGSAGYVDRTYAMTHPAFTTLFKDVQNVEETFKILKEQSQSQQPATGGGGVDPLGLSN
jgi:hypothetical protein